MSRAFTLGLVFGLSSCFSSSSPASSSSGSPASDGGASQDSARPRVSADGSPLPPLGTDLPKGPGAYDPNFRTSSQFFTQMAAPQPGGSVHGIVQIWYSTNIRTLMGESAFTVPEGTVSIKTGDTTGSGIDEIVVMIKKPAGFDPEHQDWSYEFRDGAGAMKDQGKIADCIDCHRDFAGTDYLGGTSIK